MQLSKAFLFALGLVAIASAAKTLPRSCSTGSGIWNANEFQCDFKCSGKTYQLDCARTQSGVGCTLDGPEYSNVFFACKLPEGKVSTRVECMA
jgi:hypothetical protein